jgi:flavodoxin
MRTLVVCYSRTGNTLMLAHKIAVAMNAELEEIVDRVNRRGILGYLRSGSDAWFGRRAEILPLHHEPSAFDLVIVGTPVWRASPSSPVRTYLEDHAAVLSRVAFFCTMAGFGSGRAFRQMQQACGRRPVATFARTDRQLVRPDLTDAVESFVSQLRANQLVESVYGPRTIEGAT